MQNITIPLADYQELTARVKLLEKQVEELLAGNKKLSSIILNQETTIKELTAKNEELTAKNKALEEKVVSLTHRLFGKKKDKLKEKQGNNHNKIKIDQKKAGREPINDNHIPDEIRSYDFKSPPKCSECSNDMHYVNNTCSNHVDYKIAFRRVKINQAKYACRHCNKIITAKGSKLPIPKGLPLPGLLAQVILDKFSNASPLYRQSQNYEYMNINYSRQMLCYWSSKVAELVEPLLKLMLQEIVQSKYLAADETSLVLLNGENEQSSSNAYICVIKQTSNTFNYVYCFITESRAQKVIDAKLEGFKGYIQTDGLNFYFKIHKKAKAVGCWAHVRRKFVEIANLGNEQRGVAYKVVRAIDRLYDIERKKLSGLKLKEMRMKKAIRILKALKPFLIMHSQNAPPKSKLAAAINYTLKRWKSLVRYVQNPNLAIDNNATERCIKYLVIGRKNWLFADNIESAQRLAILYSLVITCKFNNINPREYFEYIFTQLPYINRHNVDELRQLMPDRFNLNKKFDQEYREKLNIAEVITVPHETQGEVELVA